MLEAGLLPRPSESWVLFLPSFFSLSVPDFLLTHTRILVFWFGEAVSQTLATVLSVKVVSLENPSTTFTRRTLDEVVVGKAGRLWFIRGMAEERKAGRNDLLQCTSLVEL